MEVHICNVIRCSTLGDHWLSHREAHKTGPLLYKNFFLQRVDGFPYFEASMARLIAKLLVECLTHVYTSSSFCHPRTEGDLEKESYFHDQFSIPIKWTNNNILIPYPHPQDCCIFK